jgi:ribonuclease R
MRDRPERGAKPPRMLKRRGRPGNLRHQNRKK